jgi:hypothetical protein
MTLRSYWVKVIRPRIIDKAQDLGIDTGSDSFTEVLTWAHPANTSRKLHPRAIRFISHGFPSLLDKYRLSKQCSMTKSA